jgi:hypothetical protein
MAAGPREPVSRLQRRSGTTLPRRVVVCRAGPSVDGGFRFAVGQANALRPGPKNHPAARGFRRSGPWTESEKPDRVSTPYFPIGGCRAVWPDLQASPQTRSTRRAYAMASPGRDTPLQPPSFPGTADRPKLAQPRPTTGASPLSRRPKRPRRSIGSVPYSITCMLNETMPPPASMSASCWSTMSAVP